MKRQVRFEQPSFRWGFRRPLDFIGAGFLHLQETGLVVDGDLLRVHLPFIDRFYHRIMASPGLYTIPYLSILNFRRLARWPVWLAKAFVFLVILLMTLIAIVGLFRSANPLLPLVMLAVLIGLAVLTYVAGLPAYSIVFQDVDHRTRDVCFRMRRREADEFRSQLEQNLATVRTLAKQSLQDALAVSEPAHIQNESDPVVFEIHCPECGQTRRISDPALIGKWITCMACNTKYQVRAKVDQMSQGPASQKPSKQRVTTARRGVPTRSSRTWTEAALLSAWMFTFAAGLVCFLLHFFLVTADFGDVLGWDLMQPITYVANVFYYPGNQVYAFLVGDPMIEARGVSGSSGRIDGATVTTLLFWSILSGVLGAFTALARPEPSQHATLGSQLWAKWSLTFAGVVVLGGLAREYLETTTQNRLARMEEEMSPSPAPFFYQYPWFSRSKPSGPPPVQPDASIPSLKAQLDAYWHKARDLETANRLFDAQHAYETALELVNLDAYPREGAMAHALLARNLDRQKKFPQAQKHNEAALTLLEPQGARSREAALVHNNLAQSLDAQQQWAQAQTHYEQALAILRASSSAGSLLPVVHMNFAQHYDRQKQLESARTHYDAALRIVGGSSGVVLQRDRALIYQASSANLAALGRWGEAYRQSVIASKSLSSTTEESLRSAIRLSRVTLVIAMVMIGFGVAVLLSIVLPVAWNAGKRGYSPAIWMLTAAICGFPVANLVVLAALPDLHRRSRRERVGKQLAQLAKATRADRRVSEPAPSHDDRSGFFTTNAPDPSTDTAM